MRSVILGTAGHIDHGKTALVRALTGTDTDRLAEEKARGITIDLGFAELSGEGIRLGVVDVPGHEGFVRNMLAGATGMDLALLVVAGDEGVMPQTREHLAILSLLRVPRLVVAVTKVDLVEADWLELVEDEVREVVAQAGFSDVPFARVSSRTGQGIEELRVRLLALASSTPPPGDDLLALPVDRVFTVRGTGTVVTGTLTSGAVSTGERVRLLPSGLEARVRGLQVHGEPVDRAISGSRTAVALTGDGVDRTSVVRGEVLVSDAAWEASSMLTVAVRVLPDTGWSVQHNQRVRVHLGTSEVMARCVVFTGDADVPGILPPGAEGWAQLRLEAPVGARAGQFGVIRSYSPVTTIAGIQVAETSPPKRGPATDAGRLGLDRLLSADVAVVVSGLLDLAGPAGFDGRRLPVATGRPPHEIDDLRSSFLSTGGGVTAGGVWVSAAALEECEASMLGALERTHREEPYRPGVAVETLRGLAVRGAAAGLSDLALDRLERAGRIVVERGQVRRDGFEPVFTDAQVELRTSLLERITSAALAPPTLGELPQAWSTDPAFGHLIDDLVAHEHIVALDEGLYISRAALDEAVRAVRDSLEGRAGLGPADFREAIPVTRRHLLPILAWCDREGVTERGDEGRRVLPS